MDLWQAYDLKLRFVGQVQLACAEAAMSAAAAGDWHRGHYCATQAENAGAVFNMIEAEQDQCRYWLGLQPQGVPVVLGCDRATLHAGRG